MDNPGFCCNKNTTFVKFKRRSLKGGGTAVKQKAVVRSEIWGLELHVRRNRNGGNILL